ncbi:hypothetical protein AYJ00_18560 [Shewanella algae]|uniref:hypothetical protein n=1 Tax=Shewanella algae TaxID=38313 RepID=UPI0011843E14|nr:hypothetical protein [Shewanella algae]TVL54824.1 hypothetical protein AYJ00_18560 [Shewanella algae]
MNYKTAAFLLLVNICLLGYLAYSGPYELRVDDEGKVTGFSGQLKEFAQGKAFWIKQLKLVEKEISWEESWPDRQAEFQLKLDQIVSDVESLNKEYKQNYLHGDISESDALRAEADKLNDKANELEQIKINRIFEENRQARIKELQQIRNGILLRIEKDFGDSND